MPRSSSRGAEPAARPRGRTPALSSPGLDHLLGYLLAMAEVPTTAAFRRHVGDPFGLRPVEFTLLMLLQAQRDRSDGSDGSEGASATQIRHALRMPAPHVTTLLDRLTERGLLQRAPDPLDGRAVRITLTAEGAALANRLQPVAAHMEDEVQSALTLAERSTLRRLLKKLAGAPVG